MEPSQDEIQSCPLIGRSHHSIIDNSFVETNLKDVNFSRIFFSLPSRWYSGKSSEQVGPDTRRRFERDNAPSTQQIDRQLGGNFASEK